MSKEKIPNGHHPNSLKNLKPFFTPEEARKAQANSVIARKANKEAREALKLTMKDWKLFQKDVMEESDMSSVDILKIIMFKHLEEGDYHAASDIAKSIAEFEQPKLARVESVNTEVKADELSDEELQAKLKELLKGEDDG